jgi:spore germination cell wall hydrolase CwlJ-like protein
VNDLSAPEGSLAPTEPLGISHVKRAPMVVLAVVLVALLTGFVVRYEPWTKPNHYAAKQTKAIAQGAAPPPVEPLILKPVTLDFARRTNAATPFTVAPVPAAPPYIFAGSPVDLERAVDCLAATIYYEAGNETVEGKMAVVQVVLNRARHPAYPRAICDVVFQGHERRTGCQFSYTCDGSMFRRKPDPVAWEQFRTLARSMVSGTVYAPVGMATHYHTDWVLPYWSAKLDKVRAEGTHLFFRWTGFWGTPQAFRGRNIGVEPSFTKMAMLSPAHSPTGNALDQIDLSQELARELGIDMNGAMLGSNMVSGMLGGLVLPTEPGPSAIAVATATPLRDDEKGQFILRISPSTDASGLPALAETTCGALPYCKVLVWTEGSDAPSSLPASDAQLNGLAFSFLRDRPRNFEKPLWNCGVFPRTERRQCMRGRGVAIKVKAKPKIEQASPATPLTPPPTFGSD